MSEKRKAPRIEPFVAACQVVERGRRRAAYLVDLGPRGARVAIDQRPPAAGAAVTLEVRLGRLRPRSRLKAVVKWVRAHGRAHQFGLTFRGLGVAERRLLEAVVEDFRRRAAQIA